MPPTLAPVVIFIYNRPNHIQRTLNSLKQCKGYIDSPIIIYGDGSKNTSENSDIEKTRKLTKDILGDHATYHFSKQNKGLSESILKGVTDTINHYGRVIVLEDDLIVSSNFLTYMNEALNYYADDSAVYQISGYQYSTSELSSRNTAFFLPFTSSWGWATWQRAWDDFDPNVADWERIFADKELRLRFNLDGAYDYSAMLARQMMGFSNSWAIRWYWFVFNCNGLVIFPPYSLVHNTGFDGSGTHGKGLFRHFEALNKTSSTRCIELPSIVEIDNLDYIIIKNSIKNKNGRWFGMLIDRLKWRYLLIKKMICNYNLRSFTHPKGRILK